MNLKELLKPESSRRRVLAEGEIVPDPVRCVQCGICSFNCPVDIDVRRHVWLNIPVVDSHCLTCGECVSRCPRNALRFERTHIFSRGQNG